MRTSLPAAAPSSGRRDSLRLTGPAQAAARDLPGRRERQARRGNTSSVRHGAVWKNAGEAAQRADIQREEEKVKRSVRDAAKKGQKDVCVVLAKELIRSRKAVSKLYASKAHMNSVLMGMKNQLAVLRVAGSLQKSTEVMKAMQSLVKIPEIQATMRELSKEMMKAGIIEEMLEDTFESMDDQEEMEEAAEMEIDKILFEITAGALGKAPSKVTDALPEPEPPGAMAATDDEEEEEEEEALEAMQSRLATLRS
ncbi:charged multivesicular body protein 3 isoform X1 [Equus asinus]|uniref:charged multivesicular body protein 3 isoform X1 n=1 Tax=Equus asinus TaxID=9793 RepID=UPI001D04A100|nr:charged multivesicular body protein 3 isoform X1 [Equus asinus]